MVMVRVRVRGQGYGYSPLLLRFFHTHTAIPTEMATVIRARGTITAAPTNVRKESPRRDERLTPPLSRVAVPCVGSCDGVPEAEPDLRWTFLHSVLEEGVQFLTSSSPSPHLE